MLRDVIPTIPYIGRAQLQSRGQGILLFPFTAKSPVTDRG